MSQFPVKDLATCAFKGCNKESAVIIAKRVGEDDVMFGYCKFHGIISTTFFSNVNRKEIHV